MAETASGTMTGAEMVIKALVDQGVEVVFGYPGVMWAVLGRFTWKPEPEFDDNTDEFIDIDEMDAEVGG